MAELLAGSVGLGLFGYNRKNFMFDSEQKVRREFQGQNMRVKRFELYREDVRDLVDLTVSKMDNYLIVGTLQLGFTVRLFYEGHPLQSALWPSWLIWQWSVANIGAFLFFSLSMWLAMHASIAAHSFSVKMLTQFIRLPVASREEIDAAVNKAEDYEQFRMQDMLRIPLLKQQLRQLNSAMADDTAASSSEGPSLDDGLMDSTVQERTVDLEHIVLYRRAQENWQAYDAYARVCMAIGTNQLLAALYYYCMGLLTVELHAPFPALCCGLVLIVSAILIVMLDVYDPSVGRQTVRTAITLLVTHGLFTWLSALGQSLKTAWLQRATMVFVPFTFLLHAAWLAFFLHLASPQDWKRAALPAKFRTVLYLDVFGWLPNSQHCCPEPRRPCRTTSLGAGLQNLRDSLCQLCKRLCAELQEDFASWDGQDIADQATVDKIDALRERFQASVVELERIHPGTVGAPQRTGAEKVWLKLELRTSGGSVEFFLEKRTGEVKCTQPADAEQILDVETLEQQVQVFAEKVHALAQFPQERPTQAMPQPPPRSASSAASSVAAHFAPAVTLTEEPNESVQLAERAVQEEPAPRREAVRKYRPPGHMPWRTFLNGAQVMLAVWLFGALWSVVLMVFKRSHIIDIMPPGEPVVVPTRLEAASMPHALFRPRGLACHPALPESVFLLERYAVHSGGDASPWQHEGCLAEHQDFAADGVRGAHVHCPSQGPCEIVLLASSGQRALRCPLGAPANATSFTLHGGPFHSLLPAANGSLQAYDGASLIEMRTRLGFDDELLPKRLLPQSIPKGSQLLALGEGTILALEDGWLRAWHRDGWVFKSWRVLANARWAGLCASGRDLYLVDQGSAGSAAGLWKARLPKELLAN